MTSASSLAGLRVVALESRRAAEMERLIERLGGTPAVSPSMREVAAAENPAAVDFANRLMSGQVDVVVLMTGVGTRHLVSQVQRHVDRQRFLTALADTITIARGPKPVAALKELDIQPSFRVPEPNTWRELLKTIDAEVPVANHVVAVQEYGKPNASLVAGLEARGATVLPIKIYSYDFPEDLAPLEANIRALAATKDRITARFWGSASAFHWRTKPLQMVDQNQSDSMQTDRPNRAATDRPTVVLPAPGGPVRTNRNGSSMPGQGSSRAEIGGPRRAGFRPPTPGRTTTAAL